MKDGKLIYKLTKMLIIFVLLTSCTGYRSVYSVNTRGSLRKEQLKRLKDEQRWEKEENKKNRNIMRLQKKEDKVYNKMVKRGRKRHLEWQDAEAVKRIKKNRKQSEKKFKN